MTEENYIQHIEQTVLSYPKKNKRYLIKKFIDEGVATADGQVTLSGAIDISEKGIDEQLISCIVKSENACKLFEKWEFVKDYKYSVVFCCDEFAKLQKKIEEIQCVVGKFENQHVHNKFDNPVVNKDNSFYSLKFNLIYSAIDPLTREELLVKYPYLVVIHRETKLIEFRFDVLRRVFLNDRKAQTIYADLISDMLTYFKQNYDTDLKAVDMSFLVNACKKDTNVKVIAQCMKLPSGGSAQLEVGNNQEYVMPFIDELKSLLIDNQTEFEKVPSIRAALEQFMFEMEEMSDYPWIELLWENEVKIRSIRIKVIFDYMHKSYCMIQHYYSNVLIGMERMNHVIKYIVDHRDDDTEQTE